VRPAAPARSRRALQPRRSRLARHVLLEDDVDVGLRRGLAHAGFQPTADVQPHHLLGVLRTTRAVAVGWLVVLALVAGVIAVLTAVVVPRFLVDLPEYVRSLDVNLGGKIAGQLASWNIAIDVGDLKLEAVEWGRGHLGQSFDLAKRAGTNVVRLMVAFVITFIITHGRITRARSGAPGAEPEDLWRFLSAFMRQKIGSFYGFFRLVMAVQVVAALAFLVIIHKLEYFLNGKIIGNIVKLPMYMTLLGLIVGEALFGISGMILSIPTILFVRAELGAIKVAPTGSGERV
jgi:predicted PurR-regulated permease PerM